MPFYKRPIFALISATALVSGCGGVGGYAKPGIGVYTEFSDGKSSDDEQGSIVMPEIAVDAHIVGDPSWLGMMTGFAAWGGGITHRVGPAFFVQDNRVMLVPYVSTPVGNAPPIPVAVTASATVFPGAALGWRGGFGVEYSLGFPNDDDTQIWRLGFNIVFGYQGGPL
ncbi:MAG: hypothetical protein R3E66_18945 [bacterium]